MRARRVGGAHSAVGGAATGLAAVAVHAAVWGWPLAVAAMVAVARRAAAGVVGPACRSAWAWAAAVFAGSRARPDGDYLVGGDLRGLRAAAAWRVLALLVGLVALAVGALARMPGARGPAP